MFKVPIKDTDTANFEQCFGHVICLKFKYIRYIEIYNRMVNTRKIKVKSIENEEIIMTMTMTKAVITKIIITITMRMRIKIGNRIKI